MRARLFDLLTRLTARRGGWVLALATALTAASLAVTPSLVIKTNFKDLLGADDPVSQQLDYAQDNFAALSSVRVLIEGRDAERLVEVGAALTERLEAEPERVRAVLFERPVDFFFEHGLLYLEVDDLRFAEAVLEERGDTAAALLADPSTAGVLAVLDEVMREQARPADAVAVVNSRLAGQLLLGEAPADRQSLDLGVSLRTAPITDQVNDQLLRTIKPLPLPGSHEEVLTALQASTAMFDLMADVLEQGEQVSPEDFAERSEALQRLQQEQMVLPFDRYALSGDGTALLVDVLAVDPILALDEARPFLAWMDGVLGDIGQTNPDVTLRMTGLPVLQKEETEAILDNFVLVSVLGFVGILAVFIIGFERVGLPSLAAIPLLMGTSWTFGLVTLIKGEITLFALTFPVLLFGIGIDFAIHLMAGYSEQRREGLEPEAALRATFDKVGAALLTGGLTTALAFLVMLIADFYGLRDMGFTAGVGVLMALLAMLTVLPALLVAFDRRQSARGATLPDVPFPFLAPLGRALQRHRYVVLAGFLVATLVFAYTGARVGLDQNYLNLLPEGLPSAQAEARVLELYGTSNEFVTFFAEDLEEAEQLRRAAEAAGTVAEVISPSALIPVDQEHKSATIGALDAALADIAPQEPPPEHTYDAAGLDRMRDDLASVKLSALELSMVAAVLYDEEVREAAGDLRGVINRVDARLNPASAGRLTYLDGLLAAEIDAAYQRLRRMTANTTLTPEQLPEQLRLQLRGEDGAWMVFVRGKGDVWEGEFREAFLEELRRIDPDSVGVITAWDRGLFLLVSQLPVVFGWTAVVVALLVLFDLRSLRATALAMVPLGLGLVWTVGGMGLLGVDFNLISAVAIPLLVGVGIDHGVHIYHRIRKEGSIPIALERSGKPVLLTSMTTGIGFGSLMLSVHPGFHDLGLATTLGIAACLVLSLVLLPALIAIFDEGVLTDGGEGEPPAPPDDAGEAAP